MPERGSLALGSRYELTEPVGHGGMGEVWRAWDRQGNRFVAAKLLHRQYSANLAVVGRFVQERSILTALKHPLIVSVLDLVAEGDNLAIIMEFVNGGTLGSYLAHMGTLPAGAAVSVTCGVLEAVAYAHGQGIVHRDIKPDNVLLADAIPQESSVRLTDFGIARITQEEGARATELVGTPVYMAPELFDSGVFSQAADVYAVGILMYDLLAGRTPFEGGTSPMAVGMRHVYSAPPKLDVGDDLWRALEMMLSKDPRNRLTAAGTLAMLRQLAPETLARPALPVQPQPVDWEGVPQRADVRPNLRSPAVEGDVGQTLIPGGAPPRTPVPHTGQVNQAVVSPGTTPAPDTDGHTMLVVHTGTTGDPVLEPVVAKAVVKARPKRLFWALGAGAVVVVAAIVIGIVVFRGVSVKPIVYSPGHVVGTELASGLRMDFEADNGKDKGTVALGVTVNANKASGLAGEVMVVLPDDNGTCPTVVSATADKPVDKVLMSKDAVDAPCGYKTSVDIKPGGSQRIEFVLSGVSTADLSGWVGGIQSGTDAVLRTVTGSDFGLQRLSGLRVVAEPVRMHGDTPAIPYQVFPVWTGSSGNTTGDPLFTWNTLDYQATDLLRSLTGGEGFGQVTVTACSATLVSGHRVLAQQPTSSCRMEVRVGAITPAETNLSISIAPS